MGKSRMEAFSDGVIAIIITIMVLEMKVPHGEGLDVLLGLWPVFLSYVLSFLYLGIYWNNHHHLLHSCKGVGGGILWANLHLLFWLSLLPFTTGWMGENHFGHWPVFFYALNLMLAAIAYYVLQNLILASHPADSALVKAFGNDIKGRASVVLYAVAMAATFLSPALAFCIAAIPALWWLIPDRRIENALKQH
jgi:uncharacterized membrane protein